MLENGSTSSSSPAAATADETINQLKQNLVLEHHHKEKHFLSSEVVRDIIIGVSDGLTVPFALAAGLSSVEATSRLILVAGIAEVAAGAISMGLGGYLAAKSEADHYMRELKREEQEIILVPDIESTRAIQSAATIAASYVIGGLFPLLPYVIFPSAGEAVIASVVVTLAALVVFGFVKAHFTGDKDRFKTALQTVFVGALACSAAYGIARLIRPYTPVVN
ncbi:Vacuolar iron transporter 1 [Linum perenne]